MLCTPLQAVRHAENMTVEYAQHALTLVDEAARDVVAAAPTPSEPAAR